jgi:hypothetical protein
MTGPPLLALTLTQPGNMSKPFGRKRYAPKSFLLFFSTNQRFLSTRAVARRASLMP